jgi:hypothetical protein
MILNKQLEHLHVANLTNYDRWSCSIVSLLVGVSSMLSEELQAIYMSSFGRIISWHDLYIRLGPALPCDL